MKVLSVINNDKDAVTKEYVDSKAGVTAVDPTSGPVETDFFIPTKTSELTNDSGFITEAALATKQETLVSGTNIKTINNQSLLGSGNINISGGGSLPTDVRINGTSITSNDIADIKTNGTYNATSNKIATMSDLPTKVSDLTNDSGFIDNTYHDSTKQNTLVSGTNIKTINNQTLLGSGNITIEGTVNELVSPVILNQLSDGYYRLPSGCVVYSMTGDLLYTIEKSALLSITNNVVSGNDITTYWIIEDDTSFEVNSDESIIDTTSDPNVNIKYGVICEDTGDVVHYDKSLSDFITSETDPVFTASAAHGITSNDITNWNNKSDFSGSYNDLTDLPVPTDIRINNSSIISGGVANLGVSPDYNSSTNPLATMRVVSQGMNAIMDEVDKKQNTLVSGTNIKTINNESILGSGNINISGGGGTATDVQVNGTSITSSGVANLLTNSAYNSSSNKIATMTDVSNAVASKLDGNWNADDSNGSIEWQEEESPTASKLITKVASNTNNNFSQTEITSDNMLLTSGVNGVQMNTSINMTPYAINITNQTTDGSITIDADLITLSGTAQIATVPDTNNSIVNKKYVDDIVGDIESLLGGI